MDFDIGNEGNKYMTIKNENIEKVNKFKYLGACVRSKNEAMHGRNKKSVSIEQHMFLFSPETSNVATNFKKVEI